MNTTGNIILAPGRTVNTHVLHSAGMVCQNTSPEQLKIILRKRGTVLHEEHDRIVLAPGTFYRTLQFEFNPFDGTSSTIWD